MSNEIDHTRRRFLGVAALAVATVELGLATLANAESGSAITTAKSGASESFDAIKQVKAGVLEIGYAEIGPANGTVVLLLHGEQVRLIRQVPLHPRITCVPVPA